ncbi:hypothetical protein FACS1894105_10930 [Clostridia bacterium]|nr:hypothetical protein FACS1894105_10930 [Clostridia bacterium]
MNNSFDIKNSFPADPPEITGGMIPATKKTIPKRKMNLVNVGQLVFLGALAAILLVQTAVLFTQQNEIVSPEANDSTSVTESINQTSTPSAVKSANAAGKSDGDIIFVLGTSEGRLAVFAPDGKTVYQVYDIFTGTLPEYDRNLLQNGIKIRTAEELRNLLEDFGS